MLGLFFGKEPWFRAKRFGYGAGLPFKWQGWVVLGFYVLAMTGLGLLADNDKAIPTAQSASRLRANRTTLATVTW